MRISTIDLFAIVAVIHISIRIDSAKCKEEGRRGFLTHRLKKILFLSMIQNINKVSLKREIICIRFVCACVFKIVLNQISLLPTWHSFDILLWEGGMSL